MPEIQSQVAPHPGQMQERPEDVRTSVGPIPPTRIRDRGRRVPIDRLLVLVEVVTLVGLWELAQGQLKLVNPVFLPPPSKVVAALTRLAGSGDLQAAISYSMGNFLTGFVLAAVLGVALGLVVGGWRPATKLVAPAIWALYSMPLVAIRPMTTIWFGFGTLPIIFLVFLASLLPVALNTMAGVRTVDPSLRRAAAVFGASRMQIYVKVILPATVPFVLTGLRLAVITGWIILLASELIGAPRGLGQLLAVATSRFFVDEAFAVIVLVVAMSVTTVRIVGLFEARVSSWRATARS